MQHAMLPLPLAVWFSPAFPIGAFAYSHGLEWAYEIGDLRSAGDLRDWLAVLLARGAVRNDAIVLCEGFRAATRLDAARLHDLNELALAMATSAERRLETATQGSAFRRAVRASWAQPDLHLLDAIGDDVAYPVAVGIAAAAHRLALDACLPMFCFGFVSNLVSAAVRLGIVGQTGGQDVLAALLPEIERCAHHAISLTLDDLGSSALRSDLASLRHETQYSRLFRS